MSGWNIRQTVGGLKYVAPPNMRMASGIKVDTFMGGALNSDLFDTRDVQVAPNPTGQVLIRWLFNPLIK
jgi:hypothetical protein